MTQHASNADTLIDQIDDGLIHVRRHDVIRALYQGLPLGDVEQQEFIAAYDSDLPVDVAMWSTRLWSKIERLPLERQGGLRLLVGLLMPNQELEGYEAEYFILWARQQGVTETQIIEAFLHCAHDA